MTDVIGEYARLIVLRESAEAAGKRPPAELLRRIGEIETLARTRLTPDQLSAALGHVEHAKVRIYEEQAAARAAQVQASAKALADRTTRRLTAGVAGRLHGLTREQLTAAANGKPIPSGKHMTQAERDAAFRDRTRAIDPSGQGWAEAEYERRLNALADASPQEFDRLATGYRADPAQLRRAAAQWRKDRVEVGLRKRREEADRVRGLEKPDRDLNENDKRRVALVSAFMEHAAEQIEDDTQRGRESTIARELGGHVGRDYLDETGPDDRLTRRAHLARAMESSGSEENHDER